MEVSQTAQNGKTADRKCCANLRRKIQRLRRKLADQAQVLALANEKLRQADSEVKRMQLEIEFVKQQQDRSVDPSADPKRFFNDPNVFGHRFTASMVALCVNLANVMPYRTVSKSLRIVMNALDISTMIPDRETITR